MSNKKTILVVDDEQDLRDALSAAFEDEGFIVLKAADGQSGLDSALEHKPDLIMLDLKMPNIGGLEVLKQLRADEWGQNARVMILTALDDMQSISQALDQGGLEYLVKTDWKLEEIVQKVKKRLGE